MSVTTQIPANEALSASKGRINTNFANIDTALDSKVDDSQVLTNVPAGALFTDTVYTHPTGDGNFHVPATGTGNNGKFLTAGSSAGSLNWTTVDKTSLGLGSVDNTSDINKPVSTAMQSALDTKANLASPTFTGTVTAPTFAGALSGNASTATRATQDGNGNVITSTYASWGSNVTVTASKQTALNPLIAGFTASQSMTVLNTVSGIDAGTYTLQNVLQYLVNHSHIHALVTNAGKNCDCDCDCACGDP